MGENCVVGGQIDTFTIKLQKIKIGKNKHLEIYSFVVIVGVKIIDKTI